MVAEVRAFKIEITNLENKWAQFKADLQNATVPKKVKYRAIKGDIIDEMFAEAINNSAYAHLKIERISPGKYLFGTKKIIAKIVNNKLLIRVGGGFMSVEEFIDQYGRMELMKMIAENENDRGRADFIGHAEDVAHLGHMHDRNKSPTD